MPFIAAPQNKSDGRVDVPSGTLRQRPSEHLVLYAAERGLSGTLWFHHAVRGNVTIVLSRGMVWKVRSDVPLPLGELIYEIGMADRRVVDEAVATAARDRRLLGEVLVTRDMLEPIQVQRALALQAQRKVSSALAFPDETVWCFYGGEDALETYGGQDWPRVHPHGAVWQHASVNAHDASVRAILGRFLGKRLALDSDVSSRFGFEDGERTRVDALRGGIDITPALLRDTRSPVARLVYVLVLSRALVPQAAGVRATAQSGIPSGVPLSTPPSSRGSMPVTSQSGTLVAMGRAPSFAMPRTQSQPPSMPPSTLQSKVTPSGPRVPSASILSAKRPTPSPASNRTMMPPASSSAVPPSTAPPSAARLRMPSEPDVRARTSVELGAWIRDLHDNLSTIDHYALLSVPRDANSEALRAAFMRASRELRAERLPPELASMRLQAARVMQRMVAAYRMLTDRASRRVYDERLGDPPKLHTSSMPPPGDRRELAQIVDKKLERNEVESAERLCRKAIEASPGDAEALALLAWVRSHDDRYSSEPATRTLVGQLDEAVETAPTSALVYFCRARFHKRKGSEVQAMRDFMKTVELDPKHVDAERELRLYRLRRDQRGVNR